MAERSSLGSSSSIRSVLVFFLEVFLVFCLPQRVLLFLGVVAGVFGMVLRLPRRDCAVIGKSEEKTQFFSCLSALITLYSLSSPNTSAPVTDCRLTDKEIAALKAVPHTLRDEPLA